MARIETWFDQDLKKAVKVHYLDGNVFSQDNNGNTIGIEVFDDGEPADLSGTVAASIIRADGTTVAAAGSLSGNKVSVTLPQAAYAVPGVLSVVIKLTSGSNVTTIGAVVGNVYMSTTDSVIDPGTIIPSIDTLIAEIEAAVASIPADYSELWTSLAPPFSTSETYSVGQYVTYNGGVYKFTTPHSGTWNTAHVRSVPLGTGIYEDFSDAIATIKRYSFGEGVVNSAMVGVFQRGYNTTPAVGSSVEFRSDSDYTTARLPVAPGEKVTINAGAGTGISRLYVFIDAQGNAINRCATNLNGVFELEVPENAVAVAVNNNGTIEFPYLFKGEKSIDPALLTYKYKDFTQGSIDSSGGDGTSFVYCRTGYLPIDAIYNIVKPIGFALIIARYDTSGTFIDRTSVSETSAMSYNQAKILHDWGTSGTVYLRIAAKQVQDGAEINTTPEEMANSSLYIGVVGCSNEIYARVRNCEKLNPEVINNALKCVYAEWVQGNIANTGEEATSANYCRTGWFALDTVTHIYKPAGYILLVARYDSTKTFIDRSQIGTGTTASDIDSETIAALYGTNNAAYLRFSASKADGETSSSTSPEDIINSDLAIDIVGSYEELYSKLLQVDSDSIPQYYLTGYLADKINAINAKEDTISEDNDSFIFLTDYHWQKNAQHSPMLIKRIIEQTGITKLVFGGDAGRSAELAAKYRAARENAEIYEMFWDIAPQFYGIVGNHEWNDYQDTTHEASQQPEVYSRAGIVNFYINREQMIVQGMSVEGNYYIDNTRAKIRYFFLQDTGQAKISNDTAIWLGEQLGNVPAGYYVIVFSHYAYTGGTFDSSTMTGRGNLSVVRIAQLLGGLKSHSPEVTINLYANAGGVIGTRTFDYSSANGTPVCIVSGHTHWDAALTVQESAYGILTIASTTDAYGYAQDPISHESTPRPVGTVEEQAFDVFQIDLSENVRKVYITRIGGGANREFSF